MVASCYTTPTMRWNNMDWSVSMFEFKFEAFENIKRIQTNDFFLQGHNFL